MMPASKWDLAVEHLNRLNGQPEEQAEDMDMPTAAEDGEWVDLYSPDAVQRLTLMQGGA